MVITQCTSSPKTAITVAAAASTQYLVKALIEEYQQQHTVKITPIFSSSGKLTTQIEHGAPIDLFIAADTQYPNYLYQKKYTPHKPRVYAEGTLVLWSTIPNVKLDDQLEFLTESVNSKIAIADPNVAPYGKLSRALLEDKQLYTALLDRLVLGESIGQVNQYIVSQAVDWGFTAKSVVLAPELNIKGAYLAFPEYTTKQSMVLIAKEPSKELLDFYAFLQSNAAQKLYQTYGYQITNITEQQDELKVE